MPLMMHPPSLPLNHEQDSVSLGKLSTHSTISPPPPPSFLQSQMRKGLGTVLYSRIAQRSVAAAPDYQPGGARSLLIPNLVVSSHFPFPHPPTPGPAKHPQALELESEGSL